MTDIKPPVIGFVGLGVMGGPMCRNMALKHPGDVIAYDVTEEAFQSIEGTKASRAGSLAELADRAEIIFLSLPGGPQVERVCLGEEGLTQGLAGGNHKPGIIVDLSTTTVESARTVAKMLSQQGVKFADAPVARTREAAQRGELSIMVGASKSLFQDVEPLLRYIGTDVTHCGEVGAGQVVKLANNALVFENTLALAEMMVVAERAGVAPDVLLDAVSKGSGDSFALRNHGYKSLLPRSYPEKSFPSEYAVKDLNYVLALAEQVGVQAHIADNARRYYQATAENGWGGRYYPAVREIIDAGIDPLKEADSEGGEQ